MSDLFNFNTNAHANTNTCVILRDESDTKALAALLAQKYTQGSVWLSGDLGAGKTTLVRYWLQALGHQGAVKSPTYTLVEPYQIADNCYYHSDLYRLEDPEELDFIGFFEYFEQGLVIIEWASRAQEFLPPPSALIDIKINNNGERWVVIFDNKEMMSVINSGDFL